MKTNWHRAILLSLMMIFSSLAGCLEDDAIIEEISDIGDLDIDLNDGNNTENITSNETIIPYYGDIMVSTYHVAQLVSAIVGPTANVEMMSTSNIPVHDYTPSIQDTVRLANSDVFFYHGLGLEPWVADTLSTLGSDAPPAYATHTMPTGEATPDFQSLLVSDLCKQLNEGVKVSNTLMSYEGQASGLEIHLERGVNTLTFPGADAASLQGHDHGDDDHDDHGDDDHDGHDNDHDDHDDHDDNGDHDDHGDHEEVHHSLVVVYPDSTSVVIEEEHDNLPENATANDFTQMGLTANSISYEIIESSIGNYTNSIGGFTAPSDYSWYWELHVWNDSIESWEYSNDGMDLVHMEEAEHIAWAPNSTADSTIPSPEDDDHDGHDDHGDDGHDDDHDGHDDHGDDGHDDDHDGHDNHGDGGHDGHDGHAHAEPEKVIENPTGCPADTEIAVFHLEKGNYVVEFEISSTDATSFDVAALPMLGGHAHHHHGHGDHGDEGHDGHDEDGHGDHGDEGHDGHDEDGHDEEGDGDHGDEGHDGHDEDGHDEHHAEYPICHNTETHENMEDTNQSDCEAAGHLWMEGEPNDGTRGFLTIHVENEGEYGFALPSHVTAHILIAEDGHDDHSGHDDHDDHSGHEDHSDESGESNVEVDGDDDFEYDPHSWLDPVAFKAQASLVLDALIEQFPEGNETFTANAQEFMLELDRIHLGYIDAFGPSNACTTNIVAANHNAYSYISVRYGIEFVTVHGLDPEGEPSIADITEVIEKINDDQINVLYIEEFTQRSAVDSIVDSTGVQVLYLYTMEMSPSDDSDNYLTMMNKNLENLKIGMGCTV